MDFSEAMTLAFSGRRVSRRAWGKRFSVSLSDPFKPTFHRDVFLGEVRVQWRPSRASEFATDWVEVDDNWNEVLPKTAPPKHENNSLIPMGIANGGR